MRWKVIVLYRLLPVRECREYKERGRSPRGIVEVSNVWKESHVLYLRCRRETRGKMVLLSTHFARSFAHCRVFPKKLLWSSMVVLLELFSSSFLNGSPQLCYCGSRLAEVLLLLYGWAECYCGEGEMKSERGGQPANPLAASVALGPVRASLGAFLPGGKLNASGCLVALS